MSGPVVRDEIARMTAYHPPPQGGRIKLNQNESPFDLPARMKSRIVEEVSGRNWARYPESLAGELVGAIAAATGHLEAGILVGNGSNELLQWAFTALVAPRQTVVIAAPTFSLYEAQVVFRGAKSVVVPCAGPAAFDVDALLTAVEQHAPAAVVLCSPNNPTGTALPDRSLSALAEAASDAWILADEAYRDFGAQDFAPLLAEHDNLILTRTFSKAFGLAGLRVGYLLAHPSVAGEINKVRLPYNLNIMSAVAARVLLEEGQDLVAERVEQLVSERAHLLAGLRRVDGVEVWPSRANFLLFRLVDGDARACVRSFRDAGILVRDVSGYPQLQGCVRVTVGTPDENREFLEALPAALAGAKE